MARETTRRKRSGGRAGSAERRGTAAIEQMPWNPPINIDRPTEPLTEEGIQAVHDGAMRILEEIGVQFLNEEAVGILREACASVRPSCYFASQRTRTKRNHALDHMAYF